MEVTPPCIVGVEGDVGIGVPDHVSLVMVGLGFSGIYCSGSRAVHPLPVNIIILLSLLYVFSILNNTYL